MKVKKINPEWFPLENRELKVGETVEITDPKVLILTGQVVAVDVSGVEISAYDLYGVVIPNEKKEFEEWLALKKQKSIKSSLEQQNIKLTQELKTPEVIQPEWSDIQKKAKELGVYKVGMHRKEVEEAIKNAEIK